MKKFLSYALVAMLLVAVVAVSASALTWNKGAGFWVHEGANYGEAVATVHSPITVTNNPDGSVTVEQGGYYKSPTEKSAQDSVDGGVFSAEPVGLDGLTIEVYFDRVPVATNDCWFAFHVLNKSQLFTTNGDTLGYKNLIRPYDAKMEFYKANFGSNGHSEVGVGDNIFAIQTGDKLTMKIRYELGQYVFSYTNETATGVKTFEVPAEKTLDLSNEVFNGTGKGYISVCGSLLGPDSDWKYTVKVIEGTGLSEEQVAMQAFEQSKGTVKGTIDAYAVGTELHKTMALSYIEGKDASEDTAITEALETIEASIAAIAEAKEEVLAAADQAAVDAALAKAEEAKKAAAAAEATVEEMAEYLDAAAEDGEPADDEEKAPVEDEAPADEKAEAPAVVDDAKEGGSALPIIIVVVVVVVIIVAVVAVLASKKKKKN